MNNSFEEKIVVKFDGSLFEKGLDLRDISFFSRKISNMIDKSYLGCTGKYSKSSDLRDKYSLKTTKVQHSSLLFELLINYGQFLTPVLMNQPLTIPDILKIAIEMTIKLGEETKKENSYVSINASESTITTIVINVSDDAKLEIPNPIYNSMLQIDNDLKDISKRFQKEEISLFNLNGKEIISKTDIKNLNRGITHIEKLKEEVLEEIFKAEIVVCEYNKINMTGKAKIININIWGVEHKEIVDLDIPIKYEKDIISSLSEKNIVIHFKPIIENLVSKKILKRMVLV